MSELFRKKSLERVGAPEELNDYIRVTGLPVWIVLIAMIIMLVGMLVWGIFGTVEDENPDGSSQIVHPITYVTN
ncbi:MAG: hypothetical protein J6O61_08635 [Butyrivibrio sp.]|uniref:hypothetical protein n=1 Tax=Butyrivibrio sp. TaxID=28121 RepID=UPI001AFD4A3E|nr:hypothetical protein [Butyrivibrio sp.]MBO6196194.1 hypothetical protein [Butyrivibrio sp.]MBO6240875.1 hypothetical protein [Butyrivibrio sp.]